MKKTIKQFIILAGVILFLPGLHAVNTPKAGLVKEFGESLQASAAADGATEKVLASGRASDVAVTQAITTEQRAQQERGDVMGELQQVLEDRTKRKLLQQALEKRYEQEREIYQHAIGDSRISEPHEVHKDLINIVPWNENTIWNEEQDRVLMVSFVPLEFIGAYQPGETMNTQWESWVSAAPQLQNFLREYQQQKGHIPLKDRVKQYLGLPPSERPYGFVEMWINPQDLERPCLDTSITDQQCTLDSAPSDDPRIPDNYNPFDYVQSTDGHRNWYQTKKANTYNEPNPFPWTRLGYTYD